MRSIRYRSWRQRSALLLVEAALERSRPDETKAILDELSDGLYRQRAHLALARSCVGRRHATAMSWLRQVTAPELRAERFSLYAEMHLHEARHAAARRCLQIAWAARDTAREHVGIANSHGGRGDLPAGYVKRHEVIERLRALRQDGSLVRQLADDISREINTTIAVGGLAWRRVELER